MDLTITTVTAIALAALFVVQTFYVISVRRSEKIVYGDGENKKMLKAMRGHANLSEQMPIFLIMLGLAELQSLIGTTWLWGLAALFVLGRILHGLYFSQTLRAHQLRQLGMVGTLFAQIGLISGLLIGLVT